MNTNVIAREPQSGDGEIGLPLIRDTNGVWRVRKKRSSQRVMNGYTGCDMDFDHFHIHERAMMSHR